MPLCQRRKNQQRRTAWTLQNQANDAPVIRFPSTAVGGKPHSDPTKSQPNSSGSDVLASVRVVTELGASCGCCIDSASVIVEVDWCDISTPKYSSFMVKLGVYSTKAEVDLIGVCLFLVVVADLSCALRLLVPSCYRLVQNFSARKQKPQQFQLWVKFNSITVFKRF